MRLSERFWRTVVHEARKRANPDAVQLLRHDRRERKHTNRCAALERCELIAVIDPEALLMDLASLRGIEGDRVIWARGLPGKDAPESSGALIAKTVIRLLERKEQP